jgi:hypothetical protein
MRANTKALAIIDEITEALAKTIWDSILSIVATWPLVVTPQAFYKRGRFPSTMSVASSSDCELRRLRSLAKFPNKDPSCKDDSVRV